MNSRVLLKFSMRQYSCTGVRSIDSRTGSTGVPDNKGLIQHLICIALEGAEGIGGAMALEVVPAAAGRLHSDKYSKIL